MITNEVALAPEKSPQRVRDGVWRLLVEVDLEFVPALSSRRDTWSTTPESGRLLAAYFRAMSQESWILASLDGLIVGVASFVVDHDQPALAALSPSAYVTTVAVAGAHRRCGVALTMYAELQRAAGAAGLRCLTTRTWSTNHSHLRLLERLGFEEVARISDDRTAGVDSIYLALPVRSVSRRR